MSYLHGKFVWFEHTSQEPARAMKFYQGLFGWDTEVMTLPGAEDDPYSMIKNGEHAIGGYRKGPAAAPSQWLSYLSVADVDASHRAAVASGCKTYMEPTDFGPVGRGAAIGDPTGAPLCLWKGANGDPEDTEKTPMGGWFWNELWTSDDRKALAFYETLFGFTRDSMPMGPMTYHVLNHGGRPRAGLCQSVNPKARSLWLPYVAVSDCDAAAKKAAALGGDVVTAPRDIPQIGRFGIAIDTTGAPCAFITPAGRP